VKSDESIAPKEFGPYVVYERLGAGGMATVHRARKRGAPESDPGLALKRLLPHFAKDTEFINVFISEVKQASLLTHPNIAQIYDVGRVGTIYYIALEYVEGFDVRKMLRYSNRHKELLPLNVVMSILCELGHALEYAHTFVDKHGQPQAVVHRDVSPSNLIIAQSGQLKVIDFGIAKANVRQLHNVGGQVKGKLGYMSPEAVTGRAFLPASDVFSAGIVAYELLTAHPLFSAKTDYDTLLRIHKAEIPAPSRRNPNVPAALDEVVLAALSRDPAHRLQTAKAFREALEYVAEQAGIPFSPSDVAAWRTKLGTTGDPWKSRASRSTDSSSLVSRAAASPDARNPLSAPHQRPQPPESIQGQPLAALQRIPRPGRVTGPFSEPPPDEETLSAEVTWDGDVQPPPAPELPDPSIDSSEPLPEPSPPIVMPPIGASLQARRRGSGFRLVLVVLFVIAAGLAAYQFLLRPKKPATPPPAPSPTSVTHDTGS
jgi:eukaryotic-like serine/threonine-protein kinase